MLKSAGVVPIHKRSEVDNYHPVSVLFVVSKVQESAVYIKLEKNLVEHKHLYKFQSGFRSRFSTDTCLTCLTDFIKKSDFKGTVHWYDNIRTH